jgi:hypothetical protein
MRNLCPVCDSPDRVDNWTMTYEVPDGWENPLTNLICLCSNCGMIYYDNYKTQEDYDAYYKNRYDSGYSQTSPEAKERLDNLIKLVIKSEHNKDACIVDFGGSEGYVGKVLNEAGYKNVHTVNVGDKLPKNIDLLIASHVLEHVYDVQGIMNKLTKNVRGKFIIDMPDAIAMSKIKPLPILDYHQKHINHFSIKTISTLMNRFGYTPTFIEYYTVEPHNYPSFRILYEKLNESLAYFESKEHVSKNIAAKLKTLKSIKEPVIVWGCGDICLHLLSKVRLNVIHYVDMDEAFRNQTIDGIPVLDHIEGDYPIVVIAQMQKSGILDNIKKLGIQNQIIVV